MRLPDTLCLRERLPPGAAAVLLNPGHSYPDLILPIDADELRIFGAIDGHRTAGKIARHVRLDAPSVTAFLQRLWWYDQVVSTVRAWRHEDGRRAVRRAGPGLGPD